MMFTVSDNLKGGLFIAYTALGYLSLVIHQWLFVPHMVGGSSVARTVMVLVNLAAGTWCFLRALHAAWVPRGALREP